VARAPVGGGTPQKLSQGPSAAPGPGALALGGGFVFWTNQAGYVAKAPIGGGPATIIANDQGAIVATSNGYVYWSGWATSELNGATIKRQAFGGGTIQVLASNAGIAAGSFAVDSQNVYWGGIDDSIYQVPIAGGPVQNPLYGQPNIDGLAVSSTNIYWTTSVTGKPTNGGVSVAPIGGNPSMPGGAPIANGQLSPSAIAVDGTNLYWGCQNGLMSMPIAGGTPMMLATDDVNSVALDTTRVYWTTASGDVLSMGK
jgi:hypothetical protein